METEEINELLESHGIRSDLFRTFWAEDDFDLMSKCKIEDRIVEFKRYTTAAAECIVANMLLWAHSDVHFFSLSPRMTINHISNGLAAIQYVEACGCTRTISVEQMDIQLCQAHGSKKWAEKNSCPLPDKPQRCKCGKIHLRGA